MYGNDLSLDRNPIEAGLGWCCREDTGFIGAEPMSEVARTGFSRAQERFGPADYKIWATKTIYRAFTSAKPTVFASVPVTDKVVFVTVDDGLEKEPGFIQMVKDFQVPIAIELANLFISDDYAFFEKLYETGYVTIHNHTVNHPLNMAALSAHSASDLMFIRPPV